MRPNVADPDPVAADLAMLVARVVAAAGAMLAPVANGTPRDDEATRGAMRAPCGACRGRAPDRDGRVTARSDDG